MKVIFDQQIFLLQEYGGISRYICSLAKSLSKIDGVNVKVLAPLHHNYYLRNNSIKSIVCGFRIPQINKTLRFVNIISTTIANLLIKLFSPDIVHETYFSSVSSISTGAKRVVTVYDMIHEKFPESFNKSYLTTELKRKAFQRANHIICISENTRRDLIDIFNIPAEKTSTVYLGYDSLVPSNNPSNELLDITNIKPFLLFVGSRGGYKNAKSLLEVYSESSFLKENYRLIFFGGGRFTEEESNFILELGLNEEHISQIAGDDGDLAYTYKRATAFIYPSLYEGFGIPPLEAMSLGCPVICSNTSSIPEVVGDAAELFSPDDDNAMKMAIENVVRSEKRKSELVDKGFDRCKLFTWERCAKETYSIYKELL